MLNNHSQTDVFKPLSWQFDFLFAPNDSFIFLCIYDFNAKCKKFKNIAFS